MKTLKRRELLALGGSLLAVQALSACAMRDSKPPTEDVSDSLDATRFAAKRKFARTPFGDEALAMYFAPLMEFARRKAALHRYAVALGRNALAGIRAAQRRSRVPTRIVWGVDDTIFDAANADYLHHSFGNSRGVRRLTGAKLFWPEERPDVVAAQARILWQSSPYDA